MTKKVFWEAPYQTRLDTSVLSVDGEKITLKETIFFAFSGGQESDNGTINGHPVAHAEKTGSEIHYTLPKGHKLKEGDPVTIEIDWERRYKFMRLHFAAGITLELLTRELEGLQKIGAHIAQDKARIDFATTQNITSTLPLIEQSAQEIINADLPIECDFSDPINERRFWKVTGFAQVPCGGTHVKSTKEIGEILLKRKNPGKGKERVEIYIK